MHTDDAVLLHLAHDSLELLASDSELSAARMDGALHLAYAKRDNITALGGGTGCNGRVFYQLSENGKVACAVCCLGEEVYRLDRETEVYLDIRL